MVHDNKFNILPQGVEERKRARQVKSWEMEQKEKFLTAQSETERSSDSERMKQIYDK